MELPQTWNPSRDYPLDPDIESAGSISITVHFHLPKAVDMTPDGLKSLEDASLLALMIECIEWRIAISDAAQVVRTPPARTVWNALVAVEIDMVMSAYVRLTDERKSRSAGDEDLGWIIC